MNVDNRAKENFHTFKFYVGVFNLAHTKIVIVIEKVAVIMISVFQ